MAALLGWALLGVLALAAALLALPVDAHYDSANQPPLRATWLWGRLQLYPRQTGKGDSDKAPRKKRSQKVKEKEPRQANRRRRRELLGLARDREFRSGLLSDLTRLLRRITFPVLDLTLRYGLDDPADTGMLHGTLSALSGAAGRAKGASGSAPGGAGEDLAGAASSWGRGGGSTEGRGAGRRVSLEPVFDRRALALEGRIQARVVPAAVVGTTVAVALGPRGRRVIGTLWRTRR